MLPLLHCQSVCLMDGDVLIPAHWGTAFTEKLPLRLKKVEKMGQYQDSFELYCHYILFTLIRHSFKLIY